MSESNPPTKHHYIPAFYLKRWAGHDGKVTEFTKPYRNVVARPIMPERTGHQERLYELKGYEPELAQQVEERFFKPIDTWASNALDMLERYGHSAPWNSESRSAWTRFILSLLLRCPEDIALFREWWHSDFGRTDKVAEANYRAAREDGDPETFAEFLERQPLSLKERYQYEVLFSLIDHANVGGEMNNMHWRVLPAPVNAPTLLTSDRPILRANNLRGPQGHVALPIGPRLLFIASPDADFLKAILKANQVELAKEVNRQVVEGATRFVYGVDDTQFRFVQNHFGKSPQPRLMESLIAMRMEARK
ncbi:MAG: DUF4238 domain-containing protein [Mesorhizobium sp.]|uniref:DUF4238 domain-containing protein n=1 Tax=Mesorhizobium sp. TaxID=1871066 RepID=UPI000FE7EDAD|nr:DUF4238 domain-containing protein [Mesorhizobium sp.]RWP90638.1 MAG: DUF4238 domain-containing protein [Mesorhizobium sp.]